MSTLVADSSALVSLGVVADGDPDPLSSCLARYEIVVPTVVIDELREIASYDDVHGCGATTVLEQTNSFEIRSVALDAEFPLDDGENAAVTLANDLDAALLLCDEFNQLGLIHASLADTRLVTTPTLLSVFVRTEQLSAGDARMLLEEISHARSWDANSYVQRARSLLEETE
jgi:predicted nucleic acid-binding protein